MQVVDRLPAGARYRAGSLRLNGVRIADPTLAADGSGFTYLHPLLAAGESIELRYVVEFTVAMRGVKDAINTAQAFAPGNVRSNEARSLVRMNEELFSQKGFIVGRVFEGTCDQDGREDAGVAGIRVYLEDGRYGVTDENGRFHFEGLEPGTHAVQLDKLTLPEYLELAPCAEAWVMPAATTRNSPSCAAAPCGAATSCCDRRRRRRATCRSNSSPRCSPVRDDDGLAAHEAVIRVAASRWVTRARWSCFPKASSTCRAVPLWTASRSPTRRDQVVGAGEPVVSVTENVVIARLGELAAGATRNLRFETRATPAAGGALTVRALVMFDSPAKSGLRTQPIESQLNRGAARYGRSQLTITPRFDVLKTELLAGR